MINEINYPIKYAIQELKINKGYDSNYEDITYGFIISKCYVVNQNIRYYQDGSNSLTYNVVFPYKDIQTFIYNKNFKYPFNEIKSIPHYSLWNNCMNDTIIYNIFDTYEEALTKKYEYIIEHKRKISKQLSKISEYEKLIKTFKENQTICNEYEKIIFEKTKDMIITKEDIHIKKLSINKN